MVKSKRGLWIVLGIVLAVVIIAGIYLSNQNKNNEVIKIGAILPLTGINSLYGEAELNGINLAVEQINNAGGIDGKKLQVIYEDSESDATIAVSAAQKLAMDSDIKLLFSSMTPTTIPVLPLFVNDSRILIIAGSIHPELAKQSKYFFKDNADVYDWANTLSNAIKSRGLNKTALVVFQTSQGELFINEFSKSNSPVLTEKYDTTLTDYRTIVLKIKESSADNIVFVGFPANDNIFLKNLEEANLIKPTFMINAVWPSVTAGGVADAIKPYSAWYSFSLGSTDPFTQKFVADYKLKYGKDPNNEAAFLYDDVKILGKSLNECGLDTNCISMFISSLKDYHGVAGSVSFDSKRNSVRQSTLYQYVNGSWIEVSK